MRLKNRVRELREERGWSQQELAERAGLSRAGVSAIEQGRLEPSTAAALGLARAFGKRVETVFALADEGVRWAWPPAKPGARYWSARVGGGTLLYPAEAALPHDGVGGAAPADAGADRTLVVAGCDPASGFLAAEALRQENLRVLPLARASGAALDLLGRGLLHAAGVHLGGADGNGGVVRERLGKGYSLVRVADWEEGLALTPARRIRTARGALRARLRWIGREKGSGARQCQDELRGGRRGGIGAGGARHVARDHRGVAEAIRTGYAEAGVCVRLASEEAGLNFLPVRTEPYDLCFPTSAASDWRIAALCRVLRSRRFRTLVGDLPGYDSRHTGELRKA